MLKLRKNPASNDKYTPEELAALSLDDVKALIKEQVPNAFEKKVKATKKVTADGTEPKKAATKKATPKKAAPKKASAKKAVVKK